MMMRTPVTYTPCATYLREQTGDIIKFAQFEEGNIRTKTCNNAESGDKSNGDSTIPQIISKEEMDAMNSVNESYNDLCDIKTTCSSS